MKFSQLILKGNVWRSVLRICMCILGARVNSPNYASLLIMELEKSLVNDKITALYQTHMSTKRHMKRCKQQK